MTAQPSSDVNGSHTDDVHHPKHYNSHPSGIECIEYAELLPGNLSHVAVYVWRHAEKVNPVQDLEKAIWFLEREIGRTPGEQTESRSHIHNTHSNIDKPNARATDRLRHLQPFIKQREFVATVIGMLFAYDLAKAKQLIEQKRKALGGESEAGT